MPPSPPPVRTLGRHAFTVADQEDYGRRSGDLNPMHMDAMAARAACSPEGGWCTACTLRRCCSSAGWVMEATCRPRFVASSPSPSASATKST
ncbi:MAG: hypothetical protein IPO59_20415 [Betaproteobacteria bacterium]|nr:hypothetical protein [Betaproteobacteria bacterium]